MAMDERCTTAHAKLLAGTCPWCGRSIVNGRVEPVAEFTASAESPIIDFVHFEIGSLQRMVYDVGPLEFSRAARYVEEVALALDATRETTQVHGGVRPDNIFVDDGGMAVLGSSMRSNVGGAEIAPAQAESLADPTGLADYLAPELADGSSEIDQRSDIYALGCTFYYLLTGQPPFSQGTISERLVKHQTIMPVSISKIRPDTPIGLIKICEKMLAKKPIERFQSSREVTTAIADWRAASLSP